VSTHSDIIDLADQCAALSAAEVKCEFNSNPSNTPGGTRWTVAAFGESWSGLSDAEAQTFFSIWRTLLHSADARELGLSELPRTHRIHLFRTPTDGWAILTQAVHGAPVQDGWSVPLRGAVDTAAADATLAEHGFKRICTWMGGAPRMAADTYVALALKA